MCWAGLNHRCYQTPYKMVDYQPENLDSLIQWNRQGIHAKWKELQHRIVSCNPVCVCLQEIMAREYHPIALWGFQAQAHFGTCDNGPHGVVAVMIHKDIPFQVIHLKATRIDMTWPYIVAFIQHPQHNFNINDLEDLLGQLPNPFLLLGDFNGRHHPFCATLEEGPWSPCSQE